jgi:hypothetical protein
MTAPRIEPVRCACGWRGQLPARTDCPGCGADYTRRVTKERLVMLRAIGAREPKARPVHIEPQMRIRLLDLRLIVADGPPRPAREAPGRHRAPPPRAYRLTERGEMAIAEAPGDVVKGAIACGL